MSNINSEVSAQSYTLYDDDNNWLGQVVLTSDGMFASVTDYGNLSYAWRYYGHGSFKEFMVSINVDYFATKLQTGMAYITHTKQAQKACERFAVQILPALQKVLKEELSKTV